MKQNSYGFFIFIIAFFSVILLAPNAYSFNNNFQDLSEAKIVVPSELSKTEQASVQMLVDEINMRTRIRLSVTTRWPESNTPVIAIGPADKLQNNRGPFARSLFQSSAHDHAEGFRIITNEQTRHAPTILILGNDARGMLFGAGYFLRKITMYPQKILVPASLNISTHPQLPLRGHQLGYRPKTNSYDGFTVRMWESYIRDLIVFGTNSFELLPPHTDDISDSPMFSRPQLSMMVKMDEIIKKYGLNTWIWYPMMYGDYTKKENVEKSLAENKKIFSSLPKIDVVFVPGGDPGHTPPKVMFSYMKKEAALLHQYHPKAQLWMSPQGFSGQWLQEFYQLLKKEPAWLGGIVYGPQLGMSIAELRRKIPTHYPIRRYPDITHNYDSQYPVPDWDYAYVATENRESINPRPMQEAAIFHSVSQKDYYGFITYSEGINDDVNKMVWSGLGWNPKANVLDILRDYSRYFIGPQYTDSYAKGLLDLERDWEGPLLGNTSVYNTLEKFQSMEKEASPSQRLNWRFQEGLYRAYYDAYNRSRLIYETGLEDKAIGLLRQASRTGSLLAMRRARSVLDDAVEDPVSQDWERRIYELAEALFQSIHMQKSVTRYFAKAVRRGANLDLINYPLNNRIWLEKQFDRISEIKDEKARLAGIDSLVNWTNPGPGGFYDDLGNLGHQPDLVKGKPYDKDPSFLTSPFTGFTVGNRVKDWRVSWSRYAQTLYNQPLSMKYTHLDTTAQYEVKMVYTGDDFNTKIRLMADDNIQVHPYIKKPMPVHPVEFDIPRQATRDGNLTLTWNQELGQGGNGRGCQVAEVWLIKKETNK